MCVCVCEREREREGEGEEKREGVFLYTFISEELMGVRCKGPTPKLLGSYIVSHFKKMNYCFSDSCSVASSEFPCREDGLLNTTQDFFTSIGNGVEFLSHPIKEQVLMSKWDT